jgi:predicted AAA+ superfamily ATPase
MFSSLQMIYQRLLNEVNSTHHRFLYHQFSLDSRLTGLIGPRGVGKTTLLLQTIKNRFKHKPTFYFSADHIYFAQKTIYAFIEELYLNEGITVFFIDEIHRYANWSQELKNIYDGFPAIQVIFSGSSSLDIIKGGYDLSRRAKLYLLPGLSFREYLNFYTDQKLEPISFDDLVSNHQQYDLLLSSIPRIKGHFNDYLKQGYYPFQKEDPLHYHEKLLAVIDKTIYEDIANFYRLKTENLLHFKRILFFLASIPPGSVSIHNIARNLSLDDKTIANYLILLKDTGLISFVFPSGSGNAVLRRPEKIFIHNTNLHFAITGTVNGKIETGTVRELFFIQSFMGVEKTPNHNKIGDYVVDNFIFEIGGKNKTTQQVKDQTNAFLVKDDIIVSRRRDIPLMLFGFLY